MQQVSDVVHPQAPDALALAVALQPLLWAALDRLCCHNQETNDALSASTCLSL